IVIWVASWTGSAFNRNGRYFHWRTASTAARVSIESPLSTLTLVIVPSLLTVASSSTVPCFRNCNALGGYTGEIFFTNRPCETPWETCSVPGIAFGTTTLVETIPASAESEALDSGKTSGGGVGVTRTDAEAAEFLFT